MPRPMTTQLQKPHGVRNRVRPAMLRFTAMAKAAESHHVVPALDGGWSVKKASSDRASKVFTTKAEAESWGREQSIKDRSELVIHRRDGTVAQKESHRNGSNGSRREK